MGARVSVDIGGTFTDLVLLDASGTCFSRKVASTPANPAEAVIAGVALILNDAGLQAADVSEVLHGTTVGSNTLLQKAGARTGLLTTRGFRDVLEIGRIRTPDMFDLTWDKPQPLVRRQWRREIDERIDAGGRVLKAIDEAEVASIGGELVAAGVESIAVCFINSYRNPSHEAIAERVLCRAFPTIPVTTSVSVLPEQREYERTSTAAVNAYVLPVMRTYLKRLRLGLREIGVTAPLLVGNSNGGLSSVETAEAKPVFFISSGRSAGVVGAARLGASLAKRDLIVFDMGGTTASASLVQGGEIARATEYEFRDGISTPSRFIKAGGYMMSVPTIDVAEVGSGAGSIAWLDAGGLLHVGPVSAGAEPGPACYGRGGTRTTVTDANVALGLLPESLAGGAMKLDRALARAATERDVAIPLGLSVDAAASGVRDVVNANMTRAIRAVTVERGVDPRDFTLLAFGGSGPLHGCDLAMALDIPQVLFPRLPGVFTAMGMLTGDVEHYFIRSYAKLLRDFDPLRATGIMQELQAEAGERMTLDGFAAAETELAFSIDLRFVGQDSAVPVPLPARFDADSSATLRTDFIKRYEQLYHYASADEIEATSIRLLARGVRRNKLDFGKLRLPDATKTPATAERQVYFGRDRGWMATPILARDGFVGPATGPAIIESDDSTVVIPPGVTVSADRQGNLLAELPHQSPAAKRQRTLSMSELAQDPFTFAVIKSALDTIVDDMAYTVMRTARSSIVRDVLDYSCTLCDASGRILAQAKTVALHLGAVPDAVEAMLGKFGDSLKPGDIVIFNDPYNGGMHLPDIFMFKPIFLGGRLQGYAVVIAHHCDVGGRVPGSNAADSTEIYQEGIRIPPLKLYEAGVANETLFALIRQNVRLPELVVGDLEAQLATCNIGEREFCRLIERYGTAESRAYFDRLIDYGEMLTRKAIAAWPDGTYGFTDYIDGDGLEDRRIPIVCKVIVADDHLTVDFEGSSPQVKGAINSTLSFVKSATYLTIRCALDQDVPNNAGVYRCITVKAPKGSILNPELPAAVAARALTGYRVVDTVMGALAQIVPERVVAAGEGGNTVIAIGGHDATTRRPFILVDMINGAWGARSNKDGIEGVTNPSQNMSNMPVETLEDRFPILVEEYGFRQDSCGPGKFRGGLGLVRQYRLLAPVATMQIRADRHSHRPYGLFGGQAAAPSVNILHPGDRPELLPSKVTREIVRGDVIRHEQAGGGGYGDPLSRDPALVAADIADEKISADFARARFGVVLAAAGRIPDLAATAKLRAQMMAKCGGLSESAAQ